MSSQLVVRNAKLINLPLNLVVEGDVVLLRPGQTISVNARPLNPNTNDGVKFERGNVYEPELFANSYHPNAHESNCRRRGRQSGRPPSSRHSHSRRPSAAAQVDEYVNACRMRETHDALACIATESPYIAHLKSLTVNYLSLYLFFFYLWSYL